MQSREAFPLSHGSTVTVRVNRTEPEQHARYPRLHTSLAGEIFSGHHRRYCLHEGITEFGAQHGNNGS
jgi:hypothetical protein